MQHGLTFLTGTPPSMTNVQNLLTNLFIIQKPGFNLAYALYDRFLSGAYKQRRSLAKTLSNENIHHQPFHP